jgi:S1-C subfamily serine protease
MNGKARFSFLVVTLLAAASVLACAVTAVQPTAVPNTEPVTTVAAPAGATETPAEEVQVAAQDTQAPTAEIEPTAAAVAEGLQASLIGVYEHANPSVVYILVPPGTSGSGFVYSADGYIVTNNHVVQGGGRFEVVFANGERRAAELVGADVDSDLAVIRVDSLPEGVGPLPLAEPGSLEVGEFVVAIGNPFGEQGSMSFGIVSGLDRSLASARGEAGSSYSLPQVIQTDAPINPGNSGGPLLNLAGEVVGVNAQIASTTGANTGVGFSIPVDAIRLVVPNLIEKGSHTYAYLGVSFAPELTLESQAAFGLPQARGAYVVGVTPGSPADQAGLVAADPNSGQGGDLVTAINGEPIDDFNDLNSFLVFGGVPGQTIEMTVIRDGQTIAVPLTLGERP